MLQPWGGMEDVIYGNVGIGELVFDCDEGTGQATSVSSEAVRAQSDRQDN